MVALVLLLRREGNFKLPLRQRNSFLLNSNTIPPSSPVYHRARSFRLIVFVFNISVLPFFSCLRRLGLRITLFPYPDLLFDGIFVHRISFNGSLPWWSCIATALARSSGAGGKRAHVALPVSPARQESSGRDHRHRAHGKVARHHVERVVTPPRHQDDDDYTPSEDVDESSTTSESERLNSGLTPACLVWFLLGGLRRLWALGLGAWVLWPRDVFPSAGLVLILGLAQF